MEPNDFKLPLGSGLYRAIVKSFNEQARLVIDRVSSERRTDIWYTPDELLRPSDPNLLDEVEAFIPEITGIWDSSGRRLYAEVGLDPDRWRVVSEYLRSAIRDSVLDFAASTQATFRDDLRMTYDEIRAAIRREIDEGRLQNGESMPQLTKRLLKYFRDGNRPRARRIAQTEATRAHHLARERSAKDTGVVVGWEWRATSASCPICDAIAADSSSPDGQRRVKLGQPFAFVGKNPEYRTILFPPAHPHCRCTTLPILDAAYSGDPTPVYWSQPWGGLQTPEPTPEPETASQAIERLRNEWIEAENQFVSENGSRYIDDQLIMSDRLRAYKVGDAKVDALLKLAEKYPDHETLASGPIPQKVIDAAKDKVGRTMETTQPGLFKALVDQETAMARAKSAQPYLDKVRDEVFSMLEVEKKMRVNSAIHDSLSVGMPKNYARNKYKKPSASMQARYDKVLSQLNKAMGLAKNENAELSVVCREADGRRVRTAHNNDFFGVNAFGGSKGITSIAHEIGHSITGLMIDAKDNKRYGQNGFDISFTADRAMMVKLKDSIEKNGGRIISAPNELDFGRYGDAAAKQKAAYSQTKYRGGASEVPSVLVEYFHHDPLTFARLMPREITKSVLGLLDGALR